MGGRARLSLLLLLLAACAGQNGVAEELPGPLPRAVAVVAVRGDQHPVSVYFAVEPNPRGRVDVRVANRITLPGPHGAFTLAATQGEPPRWALVEEVHAARVSLPLPAGRKWALLRFQPHQAWFSSASAPDQLCDLFGSGCNGAPTPTPPRGALRASCSFYPPSGALPCAPDRSTSPDQWSPPCLASLGASCPSP